MHPYEKLTAWRKAHAFTLATLGALALVERSPHRDLVSQLRRSAIAVSGSIAEGAAGASAAQFHRHLSLALRAAREARYLIRLCADIGVLSLARRAQLEARCDLVCRLVEPLMRHVDRTATRQAAAPAPRSRRTRSPGPTPSG
jgi:four helix bundle protein